jgi:hypothetical protein
VDFSLDWSGLPTAGAAGVKIKESAEPLTKVLVTLDAFANGLELKFASRTL